MWSLTSGGYRHIALISILDALQPIKGNSLLVRYHYAVMVELLQQRPELKERISLGDQFFIDFDMKQFKWSDRLKVLKLRKGIMGGTISVETAREVVPRPDLARKRIKEKYLRLGAEAENCERNIPMT